MAEKKVKIRCGDSDCRSNLHCYQQARRVAKKKTTMAKQGRTGNGGGGGLDGTPSGVAVSRRRCRDCGAALVDWKRLEKRSLRDFEYTLTALKTELIRHHYWLHATLGPRAVNYARRKGKRGMKSALTQHLKKAIGDAHPFRDGWQTPYGDEDQGSRILFFAQHATASCCRKCVEIWHGIPTGDELPDEVIDYLTKLTMRYVADRIPDLAEDPIYVAPIRNANQAKPKS